MLIGKLWLSLSLVCSYSFVSVATYDRYEGYNLSDISQVEIQKIANNLAFKYNYLPPSIKKVTVSIANIDVANAYCQYEEGTDDEINIVIYKGLLREIKNKNELAYIIGHELSHSLLGHVRHTDTYDESSVNAEAAADLMGQQLVKIAGYDPGYASNIWNRFYETEGDSVGTHPRYSERARILQSPKFWYNDVYETTYSFGKLLEDAYEREV